MTSIQQLIIVPLFFCAFGNAYAFESWDFSYKQKLQCEKGNMNDMNECIEKEYNRSDLKLNALYKKLIRSLNNPEQLRKSQKSWIRFKDLECEFRSSGIEKGGSGYPYTHYSCLIDLTEKRIRDLEDVSECNGCPPFK